VAAVNESYSSARERVYAGIKAIHFSDAQYRRDIGMREVAVET
jgi:phosphoribosylamine-glycine ligase